MNNQYKKESLIEAVATIVLLAVIFIIIIAVALIAMPQSQFEASVNPIATQTHDTL